MRQTPEFSAILRDPHFRALCVPVRIAFSASWRARHKNVPIWTLWQEFDRATQVYDVAPHDYVPALAALVTAVAHASPRLRPRESDLAGYLTLVQQHGKWLVSMFLAYASAKSSVVTPAEVAAATDVAESTWRKRAEAGEIPGAYKAGNQWWLPVDIMEIVFGVQLPADAGQADPGDVALAESDASEQMSEADYHETMRQLNRDLN